MRWGLGSVSGFEYDVLDLQTPERPEGDAAAGPYPYHDEGRHLVLTTGERVIAEWPLRGASVSRQIERPLEAAHEWATVNPELLALCRRAKGTLTLTDRRAVVKFPRIKLPVRSMLSPTEVMASVVMFRMEAAVLSGHVLLESLTEVACSDGLALTSALWTRREEAQLLVTFGLSEADAKAAYRAILTVRQERWEAYRLDDGQRALIDAEAAAEHGGVVFAAELVRPLGADHPRPVRGEAAHDETPAATSAPVQDTAPAAAMVEAARRRHAPWTCPECGHRANRADSIRCVGCRREIDPSLTGAVLAPAPTGPAYDFDWEGPRS